MPFFELLTVISGAKYDGIVLTRDNQTDREILSPSCKEVRSIISKLKSNKAGGTDNIISDLIKQGGRTLKQITYKLVIKVWEKEQLPSQWN